MGVTHDFVDEESVHSHLVSTDGTHMQIVHPIYEIVMENIQSYQSTIRFVCVEYLQSAQIYNIPFHLSKLKI